MLSPRARIPQLPSVWPEAGGRRLSGRRHRALRLCRARPPLEARCGFARCHRRVLKALRNLLGEIRAAAGRAGDLGRLHRSVPRMRESPRAATARPRGSRGVGFRLRVRFGSGSRIWRRRRPGATTRARGRLPGSAASRLSSSARATSDSASSATSRSREIAARLVALHARARAHLGADVAAARSAASTIPRMRSEATSKNV